VKIRVIFVGLLLCANAAFAEGTKLSQKELDFFENKIRPIFAENCYKCHSESAEKIKGGLLLDSRDALRKGGETGPAIVLKHPEKSLLIKAVSYTDKDLLMPPQDRKLSDQQIADLETWIKMGAPDPRDKGVGAGHNYAIDWDKARKHWAYQPVHKPSVPQTPDKSHWAKTPIDRFILEKLKLQNLTPSPPADKVTLLRRATFDLTGLPPTAKEVDAFLKDKSTKAFEKVVDRLLASPHYGERWARYWLDLAQYGDTRGPLGNGRDNRYIYAYTYRDWVVKALNDDMPYDKFLRLQIAADKVPNHRPRDLAAMGFLTLGQRFNNSQNDIIDNRITILCQSTMAVTANCARCHDHKFDPIPTKDYYSLHGIFASSTEPKEGPLLEKPKDTPAYREYVKELKVRQNAYDDFRISTANDLGDKLSNKAGDYMMALFNYKKGSGDLTRNGYLLKHDLIPQWGSLWENNLRYLEKKKDPVFAAWFAFSKLDEANFSEAAKELSKTICESNDPKKYNPVVAKLFCEPPSSLEEVASRYSTLFSRINKQWQEVMRAYEITKRASAEPEAVSEPENLPDPAEDEIRDLMYAQNSPLNPDDSKIYYVIQRDSKLRKEASNLERELFDLKATHPGSPAHAHVLEDAKRPQNSFVLIKGNPGTRGPQVPREFFEILSGPDRTAFTNGSGRLELADAIANPKNPLTARVIVNRIWLHHFGEGIVRTPDDFGTRSEPPTHPELLDYLASTFVENGWSIKKLHKQIMLSSVYQQSSDEEPNHQQADPDNRWLWRMNRHRLDFEAMRDTILAIGGKLDLTMGGPPVKLDAEPYPLRRSIYGYVDRNNLPNMFMAFDFASPDLTTGRRESTIVPQQALFMMNSPLVVEQAHDLAQRADFSAQPTDEKKIRQLYKVIYQREPTKFELQIALQFIGAERDRAVPKTPQDSWAYGYGEVAAKKTKLFVPMNVFKYDGWFSDEFRKNDKVSGARLSSTGGAPGKGFAAIRRWTAPRDGTITIEGPISHRQKEGDGVVCRVISSRNGELGKWNVFNTQVPAKLSKTLVKQGDTIDFVAESGKDTAKDYFAWSPIIKMEPSDNASNETLEWNAKKDFSGKVEMQRLAPWEKFAQVLLETSELSFVN
jgi:hypothetical protein